MTNTAQVRRQGGRARKAFLQGTTALSLALMASAAHAQCTSGVSAGGVINGQRIPGFNFGLTGSGAVSSVQALLATLTTTNTAYLTQTSSFIGAPASPAPDSPGGGVWVRGVGGTMDTTTSGNFSLGPNLFNDATTGTCNNVKTFQDYAGMQLGADIARLNYNGANIHVGVTTGYTESQARSNGGFSADFQIPFVGIYGAVTKDGFFADAQVRWDFYQGVLNDPQNIIFSQRLDARSLSVSGNVGQNVPLADNWFIEPSAGAVYSEVKVDPLLTAGTIPITNFFTPTIVAPATTKIEDFNSILARGSLRVGKNILMDGYVLQPFVTASVLHEFGGTVRTNITTGFDPILGTIFGTPGGTFSALDTTGRINASRIGTYGQFSGGVAGQLSNSGWLGYVRGDYRIGEHVEGWGLSGGLRYQFNPEQVTGPIIRKGDAPSLLPALDGPVNWTGFSIGGSVGALWNQTAQVIDIAPFGTFRADPHAAGILAGGQIGADYQFENYVVGVAGDGAWANARGGRGCPGVFGYFYSCHTNVDMLSSVTGRVGYAFERTLFYAKGGWAFADISQAQQVNTGPLPLFFTGTPGSSFTAKDSADGWTVGAGFEFALTRNWTAKAEYMHYELGRKRVSFNAASGAAPTLAQHTGDLVRIGVNYRFNFEPTPLVTAAAN